MAMTYLHEFQDALERTKRFGLPTPDFAPTSQRYLTESRTSEISTAVNSVLSGIKTEDLVAQCLSIHFRLVPALKQALGVAPFFTIGHVSYSGESQFRKSEDELHELMKTGLGDGTFGGHAWITLPSMEILDFSLPTSMAVLNGMKEGIGGVIAEHADHLKHGMLYHPQLVGQEYLFSIGAIRLAI